MIWSQIDLGFHGFYLEITLKYMAFCVTREVGTMVVSSEELISEELFWEFTQWTRQIWVSCQCPKDKYKPNSTHFHKLFRALSHAQNPIKCGSVYHGSFKQLQSTYQIEVWSLFLKWQVKTPHACQCWCDHIWWVFKCNSCWSSKQHSKNK